MEGIKKYGRGQPKNPDYAQSSARTPGYLPRSGAEPCHWLGWGTPGSREGHKPFALTRYGATVEVTVSPLVDEGERPLEAVTHALIDTGAEESCIDERLARSLRMPVVDTIAIFWAGESPEHNVHAANIVVPHLELAVQGRFVGIDFIPGDIPQEVILGRTFLEGVVMIYDGIKGEVTISSG